MPAISVQEQVHGPSPQPGTFKAEKVVGLLNQQLEAVAADHEETHEEASSRRSTAEHENHNKSAAARGAASHPAHIAIRASHLPSLASHLHHADVVLALVVQDPTPTPSAREGRRSAFDAGAGEGRVRPSGSGALA